MAINWQADPNTDTAWANLLFVSSMFVNPNPPSKKQETSLTPL